MARQANLESGRTSLDFPIETKSLLLKLCKQENKSMVALIGDALATHRRWLAQIKGQAIEAPSPSGVAKTGQRGGRKAKGSPGTPALPGAGGRHLPLWGGVPSLQIKKLQGV